jgi:hypothetical protein
MSQRQLSKGRMTQTERAKAYDALRKRADEMGFATVSHALDTIG